MPAVPAPPDAAVAFYQRGQEITAAALLALRDRFGVFRASNIDGTFGALLPDLVTILAACQMSAARSANTYLPAVLDETGIAAPAEATVQSAAFVGASSGVPLETLFGVVPIEAKVQSAAGVGLDAIEANAQTLLEGIMQTQIADAARQATATGIAARPKVTGYVRMLNPPSCSRCVVLAGKHYKWNAGFARHPRCDCRHIPVAEDTGGDYRTDPDAYFRSLSPAEQDAAFGKAGAQAIREGADLGRVVNAQRGTYTAQVGGQNARATTEAAKGRLRLMPETIFRLANGDRAEALRLLKANGFLT